MPQDRMMQAIGRIERALGRLDTVKLNTPKQPAEPSDLQQRHDRLRHETQAAIGELDQLLRQIKD